MVYFIQFNIDVPITLQTIPVLSTTSPVVSTPDSLLLLEYAMHVPTAWMGYSSNSKETGMEWILRSLSSLLKRHPITSLNFLTQIVPSNLNPYILLYSVILPPPPDMYLLIYFHRSPSLGFQCHDGRGFCLLCPLLCPQLLEHCLAPLHCNN